MPSLRSRLLLLIMKNRHLLRFRLKKETIDWNRNESILRFRDQCEEGAKRFGKIPAGVEIRPVTIDGLRAEWILPRRATKDQVIFFVHGGGYVSGSCSDHRIHVSKFVKGSDIGALLFEYRLAPEQTFPAALDDSVKAYQWLLAQGVSPSKIVFAGDSASKHYAGDHDPGLPWISPLYGDLGGLPPILIFVGGNEILLDDSVRFAEKAKDAGVKVTLRVGEGLFHCFPVCAPILSRLSLSVWEKKIGSETRNRVKKEGS